jgi:hypothetical protein
MDDFICITFLRRGKCVVPVTPLQNATVSNIKSDNCKALQETAESDRFVTDNALQYMPSTDYQLQSLQKKLTTAAHQAPLAPICSS